MGFDDLLQFIIFLMRVVTPNPRNFGKLIIAITYVTLKKQIASLGRIRFLGKPKSGRGKKSLKR
jgi:hypothetical protein